MKTNLFNLEGRAALITGSSRGLGLAMATQLADAGADLFLCSWDEEELKDAAAKLAAQSGRRVESCVADLTDRAEVKRLAEEAVARMGKIDILINNAGTNVTQPIDLIRDQDWDRVVELNLNSYMALTRAIVPGMKERRWGRVINTSSVLGLAGKYDRSAYCATKSAVHGLCRAAACDLGPFGVTVNCIAPGPIATELPKSVLSEAEWKAVEQRTALKRWGEPEEVAGAALFLASEAGSYVTGSILVVDGGATAMVL